MRSDDNWWGAIREIINSGAAVLALIVFIALWQAWVRLFDVPIYLVPAPTDIGASLIQHWASLLKHTQVTLWETLAGFGLSIVVGVPLAVAIVYSRVFERILYPLLVASQAVPKVALAPLLLVGLGYGMLPKVIVAFLIAFFPVVVNTVTGLGSVSADTLNIMRSMGASKLQIFLKVRFPSSVPTMMAGFKVAIALSVVGAMVGEFVGSRSGVGYFLLTATGNFDTPLVFACVLVLTVLGIVLFYSIALAERFLGRWYRVTASADEASGSWGM